jgi:hypothetical protein
MILLFPVTGCGSATCSERQRVDASHFFECPGATPESGLPFIIHTPSGTPRHLAVSGSTSDSCGKSDNRSPDCDSCARQAKSLMSMIIIFILPYIADDRRPKEFLELPARTGRQAIDGRSGRLELFRPMGSTRTVP